METQVFVVAGIVAAGKTPVSLVSEGWEDFAVGFGTRPLAVTRVVAPVNDTTH